MKKLFTYLFVIFTMMCLFGCKQPTINNKYKLAVIDDFDLLVEPLQEYYTAGETIKVKLQFRSGPRVGINLNNQPIEEYIYDGLNPVFTFSMPNKNSILYTTLNEHLLKDCGDDNHSWDEGEIFTIPGGGKEKVYFCSKCFKTKSEKITNLDDYNVTVTGEVYYLAQPLNSKYTVGDIVYVETHVVTDADIEVYVNKTKILKIDDTTFCFTMPDSDIVIDIKVVDLNYLNIKEILNIPEIAINSINKVRYEQGYIGVAPGSFTNIQYSTDFEDKNMVLDILNMFVVKETSLKWQICGGYYILYSIFTNNQQYDILISNNYIYVNQIYYKFVGNHGLFEFSYQQAHSFITYVDSFEAFTINDVKIGKFDGLSNFEFIEYQDNLTLNNKDLGYLKTEFAELYVNSENVFYIKNGNTCTYYLIVGENNFSKIFKNIEN